MSQLQELEYALVGTALKYMDLAGGDRQATDHKHPDGKLLLTERDGSSFLSRDDLGNPLTGFFNNWWIGLEILHTLFALESNT